MARYNGFYGVVMCDMCGKRTDTIVGNLKLMKKVQKKDGYGSYYQTIITERTWACCKKCYERFCNLQSFGDKIKEEIEVKLDQIRVQNNPLKMLDDLTQDNRSKQNG